MDDGSTDGTARVAEGFGDQFRVIRAETNGGLAAARNRAVVEADCELLAFLDSDDLWLPNYLHSQVAAYDRANAREMNVGIVCCDARLLTEDGYLDATYMDANGRSDDITLTRLLTRNFVYVSALSPRSVIDEAGGFAAGLYGLEDYDLWLRIVERGYRVVVNPRVLAIYRLRHGSMSSRTDLMAYGTQRVYERALARGQLTGRQRLIARRMMRLYRLVEMTASPRAGLPWYHLVRTFCLRVIVLAENPSRWGALVRRMLRRPPSPFTQRGPGSGGPSMAPKRGRTRR